MSETSKRYTVLAFGLVAYATFGATFLYAIGFVGNLIVAKSIDSGAAGSPGGALLVNTLLLGLFGLQHTGMAREGFKRWWTRLVPTSIERSTYVLFTNVAFVLLFWLWQPMPATVWAVENEAARAALLTLFWGGWAFVFVATCMINHFDLFGMRQVWLRWRGRPYEE